MEFTIKNYDGKQAVISYINELPKEKQYTVSIKMIRRNRSISQNRLMWLWIACISEHTGYHRDELHELFKEKFLGIEEKTYSIGNFTADCKFTKSTTVLDTAQFTHYLERIQQFAIVELGVRLPNPQDLYFQQFYKTYKNYI